MARLPYLSTLLNRVPRNQWEFRGLNQTLAAQSGEFADLKNASTRYYPAIAARKPRGTTGDQLTKPNGLYYKNHLFWVDGETCFYDGEEIEGLTVTDGKKQLVGMGAYICIFPDKIVYNTHTGEIINMEAEYTQDDSITFEELSMDSAFCKITATGIDETFKQYDGVKFEGVGDPAFEVDGEGATKVITQTGEDYIVVTGVVQKSFTGELIMEDDETGIYIEGEGIDETFTTSDTVKIVAAHDPDLNMTGLAVIDSGTNYIIVDGTFPDLAFIQSGQEVTIEPYYAGSDKTKIFGQGLGIFHQGDVVTISGCTVSRANGSHEIVQAGTDWFLIDLTISEADEQSSGLRITRTSVRYDAALVKRTAFTVDSGVTISRNTPGFDYVCEHGNRLWGCNSENHEIYASKLGDPTNWNCFEGIATDSYALTIGSDEAFTGCISHMGHVIFFKEGTIHLMYGDRPSNFSLNTSEMPGVRAGCAESLEIVNETLYYVGRNGVYSYDGAIPQKISDNITDEITDAIACQEEGKLYLSCLMNGARTVLCYDPRLRIWDKENDDLFRFAAYGDGHGYFIDADNNIRTLTGDDDESLMEWMIESPTITEDSLQTKYISKLIFNFWLKQGTVATVYISLDNSPMWVRKGSVTAPKDTTCTLPITPQRCNKYRYRILFVGDGKLISCARYVEGGTELNGTIHYGQRRT